MDENKRVRSPRKNLTPRKIIISQVECDEDLQEFPFGTENDDLRSLSNTLNALNKESAVNTVIYRIESPKKKGRSPAKGGRKLGRRTKTPTSPVRRLRTSPRRASGKRDAQSSAVKSLFQNKRPSPTQTLVPTEVTNKERDSVLESSSLSLDHSGLEIDVDAKANESFRSDNAASSTMVDAEAAEDDDYETVSDRSDVEPLPLDTAFQQAIEKKQESQGIRLTARNVKSLIKEVITNEHAQDMVRCILEEEGLTSQAKQAIFEPKMTRSKIKQHLELGNIPPSAWPVSPVKAPQKAEVPIIDISFNDDEDDEDYHPKPEESEDDSADELESLFSSHASDLGSPAPNTPQSVTSERTRTPSLPVKCLEQLEMPPPPAPPGKDQEDEAAGVALRTRSKLPLNDTRLGELEAGFVAPDSTPDMYTPVQDEDYFSFLNLLQSDDLNESRPDEEDNDPEYNILEALEKENFDHEDLREDFRDDKAVRVSKKEVSELFDDICENFGELFDSDHEQADNVSPNSVRLEPKMQMLIGISNITPPLNTSRSPSHTDSAVLPPQHDEQAAVSMTTHVQLLAQAYVMTYDDQQYSGAVAASCSAMLNDLQTLAGEHTARTGLPSYCQPANLPPALTLAACQATAAELERTDADRRDQISKNRKLRASGYVDLPEFSDTQKNLLAHSPAIMYLKLIPHGRFFAEEINSRRTSQFSVWEDKLIAIGLQRFGSQSTTKLPSLLSAYLLPVHSSVAIRNRIKHLRSAKAGENHVKEFFRSNTVQDAPIELDLENLDLLPPLRRPPEDMDHFPRWLFRYREVLRTGGQPPAQSEDDTTKDKNPKKKKRSPKKKPGKRSSQGTSTQLNSSDQQPVAMKTQAHDVTASSTNVHVDGGCSGVQAETVSSGAVLTGESTLPTTLTPVVQNPPQATPGISDPQLNTSSGCQQAHVSASSPSQIPLVTLPTGELGQGQLSQVNMSAGQMNQTVTPASQMSQVTLPAGEQMSQVTLSSDTTAASSSSSTELNIPAGAQVVMPDGTVVPQITVPADHLLLWVPMDNGQGGVMHLPVVLQPGSDLLGSGILGSQQLATSVTGGAAPGIASVPMATAGGESSVAAGVTSVSSDVTSVSEVVTAAPVDSNISASHTETSVGAAVAPVSSLSGAASSAGAGLGSESGSVDHPGGDATITAITESVTSYPVAESSRQPVAGKGSNTIPEAVDNRTASSAQYTPCIAGRDNNIAMMGATNKENESKVATSSMVTLTVSTDSGIMTSVSADPCVTVSRQTAPVTSVQPPSAGPRGEGGGHTPAHRGRSNTTKTARGYDLVGVEREKCDGQSTGESQNMRTPKMKRKSETTTQVTPPDAPKPDATQKLTTPMDIHKLSDFLSSPKIQESKVTESTDKVKPARRLAAVPVPSPADSAGLRTPESSRDSVTSFPSGRRGVARILGANRRSVKRNLTYTDAPSHPTLKRGSKRKLDMSTAGDTSADVTLTPANDKGVCVEEKVSRRRVDPDLFTSPVSAGSPSPDDRSMTSFCSSATDQPCTPQSAQESKVTLTDTEQKTPETKQTMPESKQTTPEAKQPTPETKQTTPETKQTTPASKYPDLSYSLAGGDGIHCLALEADDDDDDTWSPGNSTFLSSGFTSETSRDGYSSNLTTPSTTPCKHEWSPWSPRRTPLKTPFKTPRKTPLKTPLKSPYKGLLRTPCKTPQRLVGRTPSKSPAGRKMMSPLSIRSRYSPYGCRSLPRTPGRRAVVQLMTKINEAFEKVSEAGDVTSDKQSTAVPERGSTLDTTSTGSPVTGTGDGAPVTKAVNHPAATSDTHVVSPSPKLSGKSLVMSSAPATGTGVASGSISPAASTTQSQPAVSPARLPPSHTITTTAVCSSPVMTSSTGVSITAPSLTSQLCTSPSASTDPACHAEPRHPVTPASTSHRSRLPRLLPKHSTPHGGSVRAPAGPDSPRGTPAPRSPRRILPLMEEVLRARAQRPSRLPVSLQRKRRRKQSSPDTRPSMTETGTAAASDVTAAAAASDVTAAAAASDVTAPAAASDLTAPAAASDVTAPAAASDVTAPAPPVKPYVQQEDSLIDSNKESDGESLSEAPRKKKRRMSKASEPSQDSRSETAEAGFDDLMKACTTLRFIPGSRYKSRLKDPNIVENDPMRDERDTMFARAYLRNARSTLSPAVYDSLVGLLKKFDQDSDDPVQLYHDVQKLLADTQLDPSDFSAFLTQQQAASAGCLEEYQQYHQSRILLRKTELSLPKTQRTKVFRDLVQVASDDVMEKWCSWQSSVQDLLPTNLIQDYELFVNPPAKSLCGKFEHVDLRKEIMADSEFEHIDLRTRHKLSHPGRLQSRRPLTASHRKLPAHRKWFKRKAKPVKARRSDRSLALRRRRVSRTNTKPPGDQGLPSPPPRPLVAAPIPTDLTEESNMDRLEESSVSRGVVPARPARGAVEAAERTLDFAGVTFSMDHRGSPAERDSCRATEESVTLSVNNWTIEEDRLILESLRDHGLGEHAITFVTQKIPHRSAQEVAARLDWLVEQVSSSESDSDHNRSVTSPVKVTQGAPRAAARQPEPPLGWSREDDYMILTLCQERGASEQTLQHISGQLKRTPAQVRERLDWLLKDVDVSDDDT